MIAETGTRNAESGAATLTRHGGDRSRKRLGLGLGAAQRLAEMALEDGVRHRETTGSLKRYLDKLALTHGGAAYRLYAEQVFVFQETRLVTVFSLPHQYRRAVKKIKEGRANAELGKRNAERSGR